MSHQRIALVTGANKGIGLEIARQLAAAGAFVLVGARDSTRGNAAVDDLRAGGANTAFLRLDLLDEASIEAAAASIAATYGRLDILVNNAGIVDWTDGAPGACSLQAARRVFETNFFGTLAVTQALLPSLRASRAARVVNLGSALGSLASNGDPSSPYYSTRFMAYNASKAAVNMLTVQLAQEFVGTPHAVVSASPGFVKTDMTKGNGFLTPEEGARTPVRMALLEDTSANGTFVGADGAIAW